MIRIKGAATKRREEIRSEFWKNEILWSGEGERGWFRAPRTLPLILALLSSKEISGKKNPSRVYLELIARQRDTGVIDMVSEGEHSYAAGYSESRGIRTWQERMGLLEQLGFIKSKHSGNLKYKYVALIHPVIAVQKLRDEKRIPDN